MDFLDKARTSVRGMGRRVAEWLNTVTRGKLSPDMVTLAGFAMHVPIAYFIATGHFVVAGVLLIIFGLFDVLDGELARLQNRASEAGMLLDASTDRIKEVLLYSGVAYALSVSHQYEWAFVAVLACGLSISVSYVKAKGEVALAARRQDLGHHAVNRFYHEGLVPFEIRMAILVVGLLTSQLLIAVSIIAVAAAITVFERLRAVTRSVQD